jgi:endonuclease/exonuclease/phosphatase family metal-dependent hydrolase
MNGWPAVFLFLFSVFASAGEDVSKVTICSWNVQNFGVTDRFIDGKPQKAAMKPDSEIESMQVILGRINPDILAASEILQAPDDIYLKLFRKKLGEAGLNFPYMATVKGGDDRIQTVLFSRFPIVSEEPLNTETFTATELDKNTKQTNKIQMRVGRGFINAVIQVTPDFRIRAMVAHLKSKRAYPEFDAASPGETGEAFVRRNEALILKNAMNRILAANPGEPLIVLGDFNDTYRSRAVQTVLGPKDATVRIFDLWLTDYFGDWWTHFYLPDKSYERIDYMFVSQPLFNRFVKEKSYLFRPNKNDPPKFNTYNASDHRPLVAVFNVR